MTAPEDRVIAERLYTELNDCMNAAIPHGKCSPAEICHIEKALSEARWQERVKVLEEAFEIFEKYICTCLGIGSTGYCSCGFHQRIDKLKQEGQ